MVTRITGLASGMDIDSIVKQLMSAERIPLDKLNAKKQTLEWQRDDYRSMNTLFFNFRTTLTNMKLTPSYRVRSTVSTNDSLLTATASSGAALSSYSISKVKQLATAATKVNTGKISNDPTKKIDVNQSIISQQDKFSTFTWDHGAVKSKSIPVSEAGTSVSFPLDGTTINENAGMNIKVDGKTYKIVTDPAKVLTDNEVRLTQTATDGMLTFKSLNKGSTVKIDYIADKNVVNTKITSDSKELQLGESIYYDSTDASSIFSLKIDTENYTLGATNSGETEILDKDSTVIGTLNKETGKIAFKQEFSDKLKVLADERKTDSNEVVNFDVKIEYQQNYSKIGLETHTSKYPDGVSENIFIEGTDSLNLVMTKVNNSNAGVSMFYDSFSDQMTLTRTETGNFNGVSPKKIDPATGELIDDPAYVANDGVDDQEIKTSGTILNDVLKFGTATETGGENAYFEVNGLKTERNSNTFEMNGVTFTLKKTFDSTESVSIKNDSGKVFDNIKSFVDEYNKLIDAAQKKTSEERYRDFAPLTDDQREQLSDKQQEQWEEKAKSGLLKGDSILSGALSTMRQSMYSPVENADVASMYKQFAAIGITTTANYLEGGKLEINEAELKKAIENDPSSVENLFRGTGPTTSSKGIIQRLYDNVSTTIDKLNERGGKAYSTNQQFTIGKNLDDVAKKINSFTDRLTQIEDRYYKQFTAMEQAIQRSNSQMSYLQQYFGGGQ